jgi:hypothetical protein
MVDEKFFEAKLDVSCLKLFSTSLFLLQKIGRELIIGKIIKTKKCLFLVPEYNH